MKKRPEVDSRAKIVGTIEKEVSDFPLREEKPALMEDETIFEPQAQNGNILDVLMHSQRQDLYAIPTHAPGPQGRLPLTPQMLREWASGDLFGLTQSVGMGWDPAKVLRRHILIFSTQGGIR